MTIRKGQPWGEPGRLAAGSPVAHTDAELRAVIEAARRAGRPIGTTGVLGGDLCRTVGGPGDPSRLAEGGVVLPIDVARVDIDGATHWFCAHLVARRSWWFGRAVVVMNAQWLGDWDLGPRAHPNDGLLDVTDGNLPLTQRREAARRARTATHLPHPALQVRRAASHQFMFDPPLDVWLDGQRVVRRARGVTVTVEPDACHVVV
jgi:hypothetical protein